jgi:hypothetical protein
MRQHVRVTTLRETAETSEDDEVVMIVLVAAVFVTIDRSKIGVMK